MFFFFSNKLKRLKEDRKNLSNDIKNFIKNNVHELQNEYTNLIGLEDAIDVNKDDLKYLESLYLKRRRSSRLDMLKEVEFDNLLFESNLMSK